MSESSEFDAKREAERIFNNMPRYDSELGENWADSHFETYVKKSDWTEEQAIAVGEEYISMAYMPSSTHGRNILAAARRYTD